MNDLHIKLANLTIAPAATEIHLFYLFVNNHRRWLSAYENMLHTEELLRARRFFQQEDKERFIISRAVLKQLSALYTKSAPELIEVISDRNKKPIIKNCHLHFNVSHSKNCVVLAFSDCETGIDIEYINNNFGYKPVAKTCFTNSEIDYLEKSTTPKKEFFKLWTRKEALLKATGKGLNDDMNKIDCLNAYYSGENIGTGNNSYTIDSFEIDKEYIGGVAYNSTKKNPVFYKIEA